MMEVLRKLGHEAGLFAAVIFPTALGVALVLGSMWLGYNRWVDCRANHSWLYCAAFQQ